MWLNWKNPHTIMDLCTESKNGSALEMQHQKNRESMRRSRQRQRDQLQLLRDAVIDLEQQYKSIRLRSEPLENDQNMNSTRDRKYVQAVGLSKRLGAENLYLKASIQYQASWKLELRRVMETTVTLDEFAASVSKPPSPFPFKLEMMNEKEAESVFGFHPFTERDVKDVILQNTKSVKRVQHQLLSSNIPKLSGDKYDTRVDKGLTDKVLGSIDQWNYLDGTCADAFEAKSWVNGMHLEGAQMVKYDIQRLEMLQEVNTNAYVLGRDVRSPDELPVFRTTLLRYRMETTGTVPLNGSLLTDEEIETNSNLRATGFVIGTQSLNPADTSSAKLLPERAGIEPSAPLVWAELAHSIEILQVSDRVTGEDKYVQVRWSGKNNYGSTFDAHRNAADMVTTLLLWEFGTIALAIPLIPSSEDAKPKSN
ncbi:unnamed protein product [Peronospora destructor]|uniref:BZIP domain-containing protein n=1 Tax=Peronospora destructor TaxID=86335 RepID=A0AAV0TEG9_9STRA|nr:unnamed protein product [Peronospora destructor]